jgi:phosphate transport system substrate-binding protein
MMKRTFLKFVGILLAVMLGVIACRPASLPDSESSAPSAIAPEPATSTVTLNGTGADFPFFIYQRWFSDYNQQNPSVQINYQPTGSEVGIQQILSKTIDFAGSDIGMTDEDISQVESGVLLLPMTAGGVAIAYNIPDIESGLQLPRSVYPDIFLGLITNWNDSRIADANPNLTLPDLPIVVVHRSDGSGTTATLTRHLSAISPSWNETVGQGLSVSWPTGVAVKSNAGVSAQIQQAPGAIGYVEFSYAQQLGMSVAALENQTGNFVPPSVDSAAIALSDLTLPDNLRAFAPDPAAAGAYPVSTYSWLLAYQQYDDPDKARALKDLLQWCVDEGQQFSTELGYVPLPDAITQRVADAIQTIQ